MLALALGMQGESISRFGGVSLQTLVVTNNMVKFSDGPVGRYLTRQKIGEKRPELKEMLLPGVAWLVYSLAAAFGAKANQWMPQPFLIPAAILTLATLDLLRVSES